MKYKVRLRDKFYEVEVVESEAILLDYYDAAPAQAPVAAPAAAPAAVPSAPVAAPVTGDGTVVTAPLPGSVIDIKVTVGQSVKKGQLLALVEAMKMENEIVAPTDGTVKAIHTTKGTNVETGAPLVTLG